MRIIYDDSWKFVFPTRSPMAKVHKSVGIGAAQREQ